MPRPSTRANAARTSSDRPSVVTTTSPSRSVRQTRAPASCSVCSVFGCGCPNRLRQPTETTASRGATAAMNAGVDDVRLPWWPTLSTSARRRSLAVASSAGLRLVLGVADEQDAHASPYVMRSTSELSFGPAIRRERGARGEHLDPRSAQPSLAAKVARAQDASAARVEPPPADPRSRHEPPRPPPPPSPRAPRRARRRAPSRDRRSGRGAGGQDDRGELAPPARPQRGGQDTRSPTSMGLPTSPPPSMTMACPSGRSTMALSPCPTSRKVARSTPLRRPLAAREYLQQQERGGAAADQRAPCTHAQHHDRHRHRDRDELPRRRLRHVGRQRRRSEARARAAAR